MSQRRWCAGAALACTVLGPPSTAEGALIRYEFTGILNAPAGVTVTAAVVVPAGAALLSGSALVDANAPDIHPAMPEVSRRNGALLSFAMTGLVLPFVPGHVDDVDNIVISDASNGLYLQGPISGAVGSALSLYGFFDALAGDELPLGAATGTPPGFIEFRHGAGDCLTGECTYVTLQSLVGTVVNDGDPDPDDVGEPVSTTLLAAGALGWLARRVPLLSRRCPSSCP